MTTYRNSLYCAIAIIGVAMPAAMGQIPLDKTTTIGTVVSAKNSTLLIRTDDGAYQLFEYDRYSVKPEKMVAGSRIRVQSTLAPELDPDVRLATWVTPSNVPPMNEASRLAPDMVDPPPPPAELRQKQHDLEREFSSYGVGFYTGAGLDPEVLTLGIAPRLGPWGYHGFGVRPGFEFAFGEVTKQFTIDVDGTYRLPLTRRLAPWSAYVGAGVGFIFAAERFSRPGDSQVVGNALVLVNPITNLPVVNPLDEPVVVRPFIPLIENGDSDFSDFHFNTGLNILAGVQLRRGIFMEVKTTVYAAPHLRLKVGYVF